MIYDLAIIGAGWAGFNAALHARALGLKTALIEKDAIGGTCLNRGCIPAKTLIQSAKVYSLARKSKTFAVSLSGDPVVDLSGIQARKEHIIAQLRRGMESLLPGIDVFRGAARFADNDTVELDLLGDIDCSGCGRNGVSQRGLKRIRSRYFLIASGANPLELAGFEFSRKILSSNELLSIRELPPTLLIVGGGVIGCESAGLFSALGVQVTVAELRPQLLPGMDRDVARKLENIYKKKGINVLTGIDAAKLDIDAYGLVLVSVGRKAELSGLGLEKTGIRMEKGRIVTDDFLNAGVPNIYAAGDCTVRLLLAHFAGYQGRVAVGNMFCPDSPRRISDEDIPSCIFTDPEIGSIGLNEEEAKQRGISAEVRKFDFLGSGMARILDETEGFIKIVSDTKTGKLLGACIIGPRATELIGIMTVAIQSGMTLPKLKEMVFAHPTLSEAIGDALR
ncbi:MAG: FAD-dependent oxidoreductase [Candidatus Omnitrophica bacterium]|nr:FAD-dependent oxidoreductase [Candidatus Omnitrophota bacterium]